MDRTQDEKENLIAWSQQRFDQYQDNPLVKALLKCINDLGYTREHVVSWYIKATIEDEKPFRLHFEVIRQSTVWLLHKKGRHPFKLDASLCMPHFCPFVVLCV